MRRGLAFAVMIGLLGMLGCGGEDQSGRGGPRSPFGAEQLWGAPGTALPPGAQEVDVEELVELSKRDGFQFVTHAELEGAMAAERHEVADARAYVENLAATDASLAHLARKEPRPSAELAKLKDGNYALSLDAETTVVLDGLDQTYLALADSLRSTPSRANREADYRSLFEELPEEQRSDMPAPDGLGALSESDLESARAEAVHRAEAWLSHEADTDSVPVPESGCEHSPADLYRKVGWQLKQFTTSLRTQAKRGSCVAFATTAGLELAVHRKYGLPTDYSEQEIYAQYKGIWFPSRDAYGDGAYVGRMFRYLKDTKFKLDAEGRWRYNPSLARVEDEEEGSYRNSCDGYDSSFCSDTNHQMKVVCSNTHDGPVCGYVRPKGVTETGYDPVQLESHVSLWNPIEPENSLASIRAHLNAGHPVVVGTTLDEAFKTKAKQDLHGGSGVVMRSSGEQFGGHAMLVVGYISNGQLPENTAGLDPYPDGLGGGYFVLKNSWGCKGDGGYMYVSSAWLIDRTHVAFAIVDVTTTAEWPEAHLRVGRAHVNQPGSARFDVGVRRARHVEIFKQGATLERVYDLALQDGTPQTLMHVERYGGSDDNGFFSYYAKVTDQFGNETYSNKVTVWVAIDDVAPSVTLTTGATSLSAPASLTLRAAVSDDVGVAQVKFYRGTSVIAVDTTPPFTKNLFVGATDSGTFAYTAVALDAAGNQKLSNVVHVEVKAPPSSLQLRPKIKLFQAAPAELPAAGGNTLLAWEVLGASRVTISDVGTVPAHGEQEVAVPFSKTFELSAVNAGGTSTASFAVVVGGLPPPKSTYVSPTGNDAANDCTVQATPCRTILRAAIAGGANAKVWLLDGAYDAANQGATAVTVPAGTRIQGKNSGVALLRVRLDVTGGEVKDVVIDRTANTVAGLRLLGGTVTLEALRIRGAYPASSVPALDVAGTAVATLAPGGVTNYAADALPSTTVAASSLIVVRNSGKLTIHGGRLDSDGAGPGLDGDGASAIWARDAAVLTLDDFTLGVVTRAIRGGGSAIIRIDRSTIFARKVTMGLAYGLWVNDSGAKPSFGLADSTIRGFLSFNNVGSNSAAIGVSQGEPSFNMMDVTLTQNQLGIYSHTGTDPNVSAATLNIVDNMGGGINAQGSMRLTGSVIVKRNCTGTGQCWGGLHFSSSGKHFFVNLRDSQITDNRSSVGTTSTNTSANNGLTAGGDATSIYNLGTAAAPGSNVFTGNITPTQTSTTTRFTTNLRVSAPVTVMAIGNTFEAEVQGADANGRYAIGSGQCTTSPCDINPGADGRNFIVKAGKLRLAE